MRSYFFNAEPSEDLTLHPSGYDREYDADDHAAFFRPFFGEKGVIAALGPDACRVTVDQGTRLKVAPGHAYVRGRMAEFDGTERVEVTGACSIVARMNKGADVRAFQLLAVTELVDTQDVCDLELAQVTLTPVSGGYTAQVTDTRTYLTYTAQPAFTAHTEDKDNPHDVTAQQVGAIPAAQKGAAGGVAELGSDGKVPAGQLPDIIKVEFGSYVGTGTYGSDHPNELVFDGTPLAVWIYATGTESSASAMSDNPSSLSALLFTCNVGQYVNFLTGAFGELIFAEHAVTWYTTGYNRNYFSDEASKARGQLNADGATYYYMALVAL